jgi:hypothetical protein
MKGAKNFHSAFPAITGKTMAGRLLVSLVRSRAALPLSERLVEPLVQPIFMTAVAPVAAVQAHCGNPVLVSNGAESTHTSTRALGSWLPTRANHSVISALAMSVVSVQVVAVLEALRQYEGDETLRAVAGKSPR